VYYHALPKTALGCFSLCGVIGLTGGYGRPYSLRWITRDRLCFSWRGGQTHTQVSENEAKVKPQPAQIKRGLAKTRRWGVLSNVCVQTQTGRVSIWIVLASAVTDYGNQKASHYILGSQWWSMIEWWISNACHCKQESGVLNISSRVRWCGSSGEKGLTKIVDIVSMVCRQGEYGCGLGGAFLILRHHLRCYSARRQFA